MGVCGEGAGAAAEGEGGESGFVGAESWGAAAVAAADDAVKDGACEAGWISQYRARRGRSGVRRPSVAVSGGGTGAASAAAPACGARCCLRSFPRYLLRHVCLLQQLRQCWRSERGNAPACPRRTPLSSV